MHKIWDQSVSFYFFLPLYGLTSKVVVVKSCHGISVKCSQYRDTRPIDPSVVFTNILPTIEVASYLVAWYSCEELVQAPVVVCTQRGGRTDPCAPVDHCDRSSLDFEWRAVEVWHPEKAGKKGNN